MAQLVDKPSNTKTQPPNTFKVVAAIPCYNTAKAIADVVAKTRQYVDEVIVIDDGSTDNTAEVAQKAGAKVISHDINKGKGAAMKTAISNIETDILVFIDGDGQHNPNNIPDVIMPITDGAADFVIGSRYLNGSKLTKNPFLRKTANGVASFIISLVISILQPVAKFFSHYKTPQQMQLVTASKIKSTKYRVLSSKFKWISDCTSGFIAMRKDHYRNLSLISNGFQIETEMIFEQAKNGFIIAETPIDCKWGDSVSKLSIISDGFRTFCMLTKKLFTYSKANK
jgi:hypothetical protein